MMESENPQSVFSSLPSIIELAKLAQIQYKKRIKTILLILAIPTVCGILQSFLVSYLFDKKNPLMLEGLFRAFGYGGIIFSILLFVVFILVQMLGNLALLFSI